MKIGMASPRSNRRPPTRARGQDWLYGEGGLRAGWRLLSFAALVSALLAMNRLVLIKAEAAGVARDARFVGERLMIFVAFLLASWIMGRIEGRTLADYGLPWRLMFGRRFWQGVAIGFASLTLLLAILAAVGAFHFGEIVLRGAGPNQHILDEGPHRQHDLTSAHGKLTGSGAASYAGWFAIPKRRIQCP